MTCHLACVQTRTSTRGGEAISMAFRSVPFLLEQNRENPLLRLSCQFCRVGPFRTMSSPKGVTA